MCQSVLWTPNPDLDLENMARIRIRVTWSGFSNNRRYTDTAPDSVILIQYNTHETSVGGNVEYNTPETSVGDPDPQNPFLGLHDPDPDPSLFWINAYKIRF